MVDGIPTADCQACPFRSDCTRSVTAGHQVVVPSRWLYEIQRRNRADQDDPEWRHRYYHRAGVEGAISEAARAYGVRRCRYLGLEKTRVQHQLAACGMNAARIADWIERDSQPAPRDPKADSQPYARQLRRVSQQSPVNSRFGWFLLNVLDALVPAAPRHGGACGAPASGYPGRRGQLAPRPGVGGGRLHQ
ncbi:transposase [Frankia sp. CiP3]|uniref:transposase n=1 Tax=Frankia sp. CiP3 TaxID=2880971 RepID=UPI0035AB8A1C